MFMAVRGVRLCLNPLAEAYHTWEQSIGYLEIQYAQSYFPLTSVMLGDPIHIRL